MMKKIYQMTKIKLALIAVLAVAASCSKDKAVNTVDANQVGLKLSLTEAEFTSNDPVTKASTSSSTTKPLNIIKEIQSGPFSITAELTENTSSNVALRASSGNKAATSSLALRGTVQYRVVAYETDGTYVDQAVGNAADSTQVFFGDKLIAGNKYTFVVYSVGSTTTAPPAAPTTNLYSAGALFFDFSTYAQDGGDLMYAISKDVTILSNNTPTPLTAPLQHLFTRVNIVVDNSDATGTYGTANYVKGGYLSEVPVQAQWLSPFQDVQIDLSTGATVSSVADNSVAAISNLNATAQTFIVNQLQSSTFAVSLRIPSNQIKIGHDINAQNVDFNFSNAGLGLKPGYAYTLKLRFNSDRYVNPNNVTRTATAADARYAVIGGYRWDRYNLGVSSVSPATNNPDAIPSNQGLYGNFYQWGRQTPGGNAYSGDGAITGWSTISPADGAWNNGTAVAPVKSATDPCSPGNRVPSPAEFTLLGNNTKHASIGNWIPQTGTTAGLSDFTAAHVMTSKKSSDIQLSFPAAGFRSNIDGKQLIRQSSASYWLNTEVGGNTQARIGRGFTSSWDTSFYQKNGGFPVRCIQDK
jgi:Fibrobacter succinogenes major domain (Fib_succ_major).